MFDPEDRDVLANTVKVALLIIAALSFVFLFLAVAAHARDPDGWYAESPNAVWFRSQHNARGEWCCDKADGHKYYGNYVLNTDGSVTLENGKTLPAYMVLKGPNPTGAAVWWYLDDGTSHYDYCFSPGSLG